MQSCRNDFIGCMGCRHFECFISGLQHSGLSPRNSNPRTTWRAEVLRLCPGFDNIIKQTYCKMYIVHALHCTLYHKDQSSVS